MGLSGKQQLILLAFASVLVAVSAKNFIAGSRHNKDGVVCFGDIILHSIPGKNVTAYRVCRVPRWNQTINYIEAFDRSYSGKGEVRIVNGGLYKKNVTLELSSLKGQPLNFTVQIYATPIW